MAFISSSMNLRFIHVLVRHNKDRALSKILRKQILSYLPAHPREIYQTELSKPPSFLHGDLNQENLLGKFKEGMKWQPIGLIDYGDSMVGDKLYDLVTAHIDLFVCDKNLTLEMIKSYGINDWKREDFAYKAMCYTLLHKEDPFRTVFKQRPEWENCKTLFELEELIFDIPELESGDIESLRKKRIDKLK